MVPSAARCTVTPGASVSTCGRSSRPSSVSAERYPCVITSVRFACVVSRTTSLPSDRTDFTLRRKPLGAAVEGSETRTSSSFRAARRAVLLENRSVPASRSYALRAARVSGSDTRAASETTTGLAAPPSGDLLEPPHPRHIQAAHAAPSHRITTRASPVRGQCALEGPRKTHTDFRVPTGQTSRRTEVGGSQGQIFRRYASNAGTSASVNGRSCTGGTTPG